MRVAVSATVLFSAALHVQAASSVLTWHNNNQRTGANTSETILKTANVSVATFGKLFTMPVDGQVYAQPLYVPALTVGGASHNTVFVATEFNSIYAFDADTPGSPLWQTNFNHGPQGTAVTPVPSTDVGVADIHPWIGITSTPVIDPVAGVLYAVVKTKEITNGSAAYVQRIHGLDLLTGAETFTPIVIQASVTGTCGNVVGTNVVFDPLIQNQRSALLLSNGVLYIAWASHGDLGAFNGWVMGYNTSTLQQTAVFNTTANDPTGECLAGIWLAGGGPATDLAGNIFLLTGNGAFDANKGGTSYGDSALRLAPGPTGLSVADYFTPSDQSSLNSSDLDLAGSGATVILPVQPGAHPHLMAASGKAGNLYLLDRDNLGHYNAKHDTSVETIPLALGDGASAYPPGVYFNERLYYAASNDTVKAFQLQNGLLLTIPVAASQTRFGYLGAGLSISAAPDGSGAIVWATEGTSTPGILHAYDAGTLKELYNTSQAAGKRDVPGGAVKFVAPTVINGKVYVETANSVAVYGLLEK